MNIEQGISNEEGIKTTKKLMVLYSFFGVRYFSTINSL